MKFLAKLRSCLVVDAFATLIAHWMGNPVHVMEQGAMRACADLLRAGNSAMRRAVICKMDADSSCQFSVLTVLDAISRDDPEVVRPLQNQIDHLRQSHEHGVRCSAGLIAAKLGLTPLSRRSVSEIRDDFEDRVLIALPPKIVGSKEDISYDVIPDSLDPIEIIGPWREEAKLIAKMAGLRADSVVARIVDVMRALQPESTWNADAECELRHRLDKAGLRFPFIRPRVAIARRALHYVVAELADGQRLPTDAVEELHRVLRHADSRMLLHYPRTRPPAIVPAEVPQYERYSKEWVDLARQVGPSSLCRSFDEWMVVGEQSFIKPSGERMPRETRRWTMIQANAHVPSPDMDESEFFPWLIRETSESYFTTTCEHEEVVVSHASYGFETPGDDWIAINPEIGRSLNWTPVTGELFGWQTNGEVMAKSVWWSDGLVEQGMEFWKRCEVAEGWLAVVSKRAFEELKRQFGPFKSIAGVTRQIHEHADGSYKRTSYFDVAQ
jgi:hypothetical protein